MTARVSLLPSSVTAACDAEAEVWAEETGLNEWLSRMVKSEQQVAMLRKIAMQCFSEGVYRGAMNVIDGKSLVASIEDGRAAKAIEKAGGIA